MGGQIDPNFDHNISLNKAAEMTKRYRDTQGEDLKRGGIFSRKAILQLFERPDVEALKYYFAIKDDGEPAIVLVGCDVEGDDKFDTSEPDTAQKEIKEIDFKCPPICFDHPNKLNRDGY